VNAVSRFDAKRHKKLRGSAGLSAWAPTTLYAAGAAIAALFLFQLFFRYQYFDNNGALWRVDRLTQQTCRVDSTRSHCAAPQKITKFSTSTSTSTSTSLSVEVKSGRKKH
jgi:hypothetical protein